MLICKIIHNNFDPITIKIKAEIGNITRRVRRITSHWPFARDHAPITRVRGRLKSTKFSTNDKTWELSRANAVGFQRWLCGVGLVFEWAVEPD